MGTPFIAAEAMIQRAFLSVPMGGLMRGLEASPTFGPQIKAGLAAAGILPGSAAYQQYLTIAQTVIGAMDPINWAVEAATFKSIVLHEVIGDTVVPNFVATAPLSGTEPLIKAMGLAGYSTTQSGTGDLSLAGRFVPPASHSSLLSPATSPAATAEMQAQMAAFIASKGTSVVVSNAATMVPQ